MNLILAILSTITLIVSVMVVVIGLFLILKEIKEELKVKDDTKVIDINKNKDEDIIDYVKDSNISTKIVFIKHSNKDHFDPEYKWYIENRKDIEVNEDDIVIPEDLYIKYKIENIKDIDRNLINVISKAEKEGKKIIFRKNRR